MPERIRLTGPTTCFLTLPGIDVACSPAQKNGETGFTGLPSGSSPEDPKTHGRVRDSSVEWLTPAEVAVTVIVEVIDW